MSTQTKTRREKFTEVYHTNAWHGTASISGTGSDRSQTALIRQQLPALLKQLGAKSLVDAPCGDLHWIKTIDLAGGGVDYIGVDIVQELVDKLAAQYGSGGGRRFECLDLVMDILPQADVILCRDCLVHLPLEEVRIVIRNFIKSGATWLVTTTFPSTTENTNVRWSGWRPLNLEIAPFTFPKAMRYMIEGCTEDDGKYADKSLAVWKLADLAGVV